MARFAGAEPVLRILKEMFVPQGKTTGQKVLDGTLRYGGDAFGSSMLLGLPGVGPMDIAGDFALNVGTSAAAGQLAAMAARRLAPGSEGALRAVGEMAGSFAGNFIERPWQARLRQQQEQEVQQANTAAQKQQAEQQQREQQLQSENAELQKLLAETLFPGTSQVLRSAMNLAPTVVGIV